MYLYTCTPRRKIASYAFVSQPPGTVVLTQAESGKRHESTVSGWDQQRLEARSRNQPQRLAMSPSSAAHLYLLPD